MYSHCIYCRKPLGANEVVEAFPVGRRLAFDSAKGRLWVVCRKCERWNLSPLEERWEAFEECERLFSVTRMRMSTDEVGLARLSEGLELVRIGAPQRPEFAAWRYGDQFGRRRRRAILWTTAGVVAGAAVFAGAAAAGITVGALGNLPNAVMNIPVRARVKTRDGRVLKLRQQQLRQTRFFVNSESDELGVSIKVKRKQIEVFTGDDALRVAGVILPKLNYMSGSKKVIKHAVDQIEDAGHPEVYLARLRAEVEQRTRGPMTSSKQRKQGEIHRLPKPTKLALEMALHEEQERRALAGELIDLELAWREAEEIAGIADNLLVPAAVEQRVEEMKAEGS